MWDMQLVLLVWKDAMYMPKAEEMPKNFKCPKTLNQHKGVEYH